MAEEDTCKIKVVGNIKNPELIGVEDAGVFYIENVSPGTKIVRYKGQEKKVVVALDGKVPVVKFKEPEAPEEKAARPKEPGAVEAEVITGIKVTSEPDQLIIYFNQEPTKWRTPHMLKLSPGVYIIGVEGDIDGDAPVTVTQGEVTDVHIIV